MKQLFPGETIEAQSNGKSDRALRHWSSSKDIIDKAINVAAGYVDKADEVVNLLRLQETPASNQVLLRVRFAEVSRSAMTELGASFFTSPTAIKNIAGTRRPPQQFAARRMLRRLRSGSAQKLGRSATSSTCSCSIRSTSWAR